MKTSVTGMADTVSVAGPALGGGHGLLQGMYGLAADQLLGARVVLGNGQIVSASKDSNPDLYWALKGAGHNFGIVVEMTFRIYDMLPEKREWAAETMIFSEDKLEDVFTVANEILDEQPADFLQFMYFIRQPEVDARKVSPQAISFEGGY